MINPTLLLIFFNGCYNFFGLKKPLLVYKKIRTFVVLIEQYYLNTQCIVPGF